MAGLDPAIHASRRVRSKKPHGEPFGVHMANHEVARLCRLPLRQAQGEDPAVRDGSMDARFRAGHDDGVVCRPREKLGSAPCISSSIAWTNQATARPAPTIATRIWPISRNTAPRLSSL